MQSIRRAVLPGGIALLAVFVVVALSSAKDQTPLKPADLPATVIAHLSLPQATGSQMLLQDEKGKKYLYVQEASKQGFMVVDVTKPDRPSLLKRTAASNEATAGTVEMLSPDLAIAQAPEKKPTTITSNSHPTDTVRILDLSDPHNPKTLQEFSGVTGVLPDGGHGLIYLTNNQGLWVLRYNRPALLEPAKKKKPCDSESEIEAMPPECD
jgi:hypothetical protein